MRPLPLLALVACAPADPDPIEITGYLDADRLAVAAVGGPSSSVVAGLAEPGAVTGVDQIQIRNERADRVWDVPIEGDGGFAVELSGQLGDVFQFEVRDVGSLDFALDRAAPFPDTVSINPHAPDAEGQAVFTLELAQAGDHDFLLASPDSSATSAMHSTTATVWEGAIPAHSGDTVWLTALDADRNPTQAHSLTVP